MKITSVVIGVNMFSRRQTMKKRTYNTLFKQIKIKYVVSAQNDNYTKQNIQEATTYLKVFVLRKSTTLHKLYYCVKVFVVFF